MANFEIKSEYDGLSMPYSLEAEQAVLGAIMFDSQCLEQVVDIILNPDYFYISFHKQVYSVMMEMFTLGQNLDFVTILNKLNQVEGFEQSNNKNYLIEIADSVPSISNVIEYAKIVKDKFELRSLINTARTILDDAFKANEETRVLIDSAEQMLYDLRRGKDVKGLVHIREPLIETFDRLDDLNTQDSEGYRGIPIGIDAIDEAIMGLNRSDLILIAARPGMGKTSFALNIASNVSIRSKKKVAFFSLEMTREQLASRVLSSTAEVSSNSIRTGRLSPTEWANLIEAGDEIAKSKIYIDDTSNITVPQMKAKLRRIHDVDLVIIDYLQLMSGSKRTDNRVQEISEITRSLKIMAKELNIPVITLSQLSRASEQRAQHRPVLSDLRDSGSIEQDADIVMFLYRPNYYTNDENENRSEYESQSEDKNAGECIIAKNRHGEVKTVGLHWQGEYMRFTAEEKRYVSE